MKSLESVFEAVLWNSRLIVIVAVVSSLAAAMAMFFLASVDTWFLISHLGDYISSTLSPAGRGELRANLITHVVEIIDGFLLATVLLIFALGLYELFISKIDVAESSDNANNVLMINSLDDLKTRLAKVVLMILIVKFFEHALSMKFSTSLDMLYFAGGIALIGLALYLTHSGDGQGGSSH